MDYQYLAERNQDDAKKCFYQYDDNENGFLEPDELKELFLDMGHSGVKNMRDFDEWLEEQYKNFDQNKVILIYHRTG